MTPPLLTFVVVSYGGVDDAIRLVALARAPTRRSTSCCAPTSPATPRPRRRPSPTTRGCGCSRSRTTPATCPRCSARSPTSTPRARSCCANCDLVADPGLVAELLRRADAFPDAGWLAPAVIGSLGRRPEPEPARAALGPVAAGPRRGAPGAPGGRPAAAAQGGPQLAHRQRGRAAAARCSPGTVPASCSRPGSSPPAGRATTRSPSSARSCGSRGSAAARPRGALRAQRGAAAHRARRHRAHPPRRRGPGQVRRAALLGPRAAKEAGW